MKHSKFIKWVTAAAIGVFAVAFSAGITAYAETGTGTTESGLEYSYDTETGQATITGYTGTSRSVTIPSDISGYTVTGIGSNAFYKKTITSAELPDTVKSIGSNSFFQCFYLSKITMRQVQEIGPNAFYYCYQLNNLSVPNAKTIGVAAFQFCSGLKSLNLPKAETIGRDAFSHCNSLESISLPMAKTIDLYAFYSCANLYYFSALKAETLGVKALSQCPQLTNVYLPNVKIVDRSAFERSKALTRAYLSHVESIESQAFFECTALTKITLPVSLTYIGEYAFEKCENLESVTLSSGLITIDTAAFRSCLQLQSIAIPASVTSVGRYAFEGCTSLESVNIPGATVLNTEAFKNCTALTSVQLADSSKSNQGFWGQAFSNNPLLYTVNGVPAMSYQTDSEGYQYPVLNPAITTAIRNHFSRSINVGFVNEFCTALCNYIVATETDPWMNDALKARQLHDWLVRHCEYEDCLNGETLNDNDNHVASSVFLSYAINVRGQGVGETVCDGFAKAYTMLLTAAGIESYFVGNDFHAWNMVKIGDKFYHVDVTWDNHTQGTMYGTMYNYFLKYSTEHGINNRVEHPNDHPLLMVYNNASSDMVDNCTESYPDANCDGILDDDFNLNGVGILLGDWEADTDAWHHWELMFGGTMYELDNKLPIILYYLHQHHEDYETYIAQSGPKSTIVAAGETAHFSVNLFGEGLTYQWKYWDTNHWVDVNDPSAATSELSFTATPEMNGRFIICFIHNKDNVLFYPDFVSLTVI